MRSSSIFGRLPLFILILAAGMPVSPSPGAPPLLRPRPDREVLLPDLLDTPARGRLIQLPVAPGQEREGRIQLVKQDRSGRGTVSGRLIGTESGTFALEQESGGLRGMVILPERGLGQVYEPMGNGHTRIREYPLRELMCFDVLPPAPAEADVTDEPVPPLPAAPPLFESLPAAVAVVYLDMDGEVVTNSHWNGGAVINAASPNFTAAKVEAVWQRVAEDFRPFQINVTTDAAVYAAAPENRRIRCIITPTGSWYGSAGGVAYVGSFRWSGDTPCWVFNTGEKSSAEAASHEVGHTLGLGHDGKEPDTVYYGGHGSGTTGWAPIMGVGYSRNLVQWSKGEYTDANNSQDDLAIITASNNGFGYRADDHGSDQASAALITPGSLGEVNLAGVIERNNDVDVFRIETAGGDISLDLTSFAKAPNLDILATLVDDSGTELVSSNPADDVDAVFAIGVPEGTYYLQVTGTGKGDPLDTGYTDYASLGEYTVTGTIVSAAPDQVFTIAENTPAPVIIGTITSSYPPGDELVYTLLSGLSMDAFIIDTNGQLYLTDGSLLDHETRPQMDLVVRVSNISQGAISEDLLLRIQVLDVNEPPTFPGADPVFDIPESAPDGSPVGVVVAVDSESGISYQIISGDTGGAFAIDQSGLITVAQSILLDAGTLPSYPLVIRATDEGLPALEADRNVTIRILDTLVAPQASLHYRVPVSDIEDGTWNQPDFSDAHWDAGTGGVGYDLNSDYLPYIGSNVETAMHDERTSVYLRLPFTLLDTANLESLRLTMRYDDGFIAYLNGVEVTRRNAPSSPSWLSEATSLHNDSEAVIPEPFDLTVYLGLLHDGENILAVHGLNDNTGSSDLLIQPELLAAPSAVVTIRPPEVSGEQVEHLSAREANLQATVAAKGEIPAVHLFWGTSDGGTDPAAWQTDVDLGVLAGPVGTPLTDLEPDTDYAFRVRAVNSAGTAWSTAATVFRTPKDAIVWVDPGNAVRFLVPVTNTVDEVWMTPAFDAAGWSTGLNALGYEENSGYEDLIRTDVGVEMYEQQVSTYVRIPFTLQWVPALEQLVLDMQYDDAFVAYLNGVEVARSDQAPATPAWDTPATGSHSDSAAKVPQPFDLSAHIGLLQAGPNTLALHGLNTSVNSSDFLVRSRLTGFLPVGPAYRYDQWLADRPALVGASADPFADPDGDGWINALEFALAGNPLVPDSEALHPTLVIHAPHAEYTFRRRANFLDTGIQFTVEQKDLMEDSGWLPVSGSVTDPPVPDPGGNFEQVTVRIPLNSAQNYLRLQVTIPGISP